MVAKVMTRTEQKHCLQQDWNKFWYRTLEWQIDVSKVKAPCVCQLAPGALSCNRLVTLTVYRYRGCSHPTANINYWLHHSCCVFISWWHKWWLAESALFLGSGWPRERWNSREMEFTSGKRKSCDKLLIRHNTLL